MQVAVKLYRRTYFLECLRTEYRSRKVSPKRRGRPAKAKTVKLESKLYKNVLNSRDLRYPATASRSNTICAMKRWMRRKLDSRDALLSNATANLDKQTVCTVQSAHSSMERHLMWARFIEALKIGRITGEISLLLCETLVFRNMVIMWKLYTLKLRKIEVFSKYNYLKINKLRQYFSNFVMY